LEELAVNFNKVFTESLVTMLKADIASAQTETDAEEPKTPRRTQAQLKPVTPAQQLESEASHPGF